MHNMETKRQTESILAKLMGLDRPLPKKQLQRGQQRVLSESYLQDIALICQHQKWSFDRYSMDVDEMLENDSSEGVQSSSSSEESLGRYRQGADKNFWLLSSLQKDDEDYASCGANYLQKLLKSPNEMERVAHMPPKSVLQNENVGNTHYLQLHSSCSTGGNPKTSSSVRKKGICLGKRERDCPHYGRKALGRDSMVTHGVAEQVANQLQQSVWHDYLNAFRYGSGTVEVESQNPHVLDRGFMKLNNSPGNLNASNSKVGHAQCISNFTSFLFTGNSKSRNMTYNVHKDWCLNLVNGGSSYCSRLQEATCKSKEDLRPRNSTSIASLDAENYVSCKETPLKPSDLNEFGEKDVFEENCSVPVSSEKISTCFDVESVAKKEMEGVLDELPDILQEIGSSIRKECKEFDALTEQFAEVVDETLMPLHELDDGSPLYSTEDESVSKLKDTSAAHLHAFSGLEIKLHQPIAEFCEPEAERPKRMRMSMDIENSQREGIIFQIGKIEEAQVSSYLLDVLAELDLQCGNMEMCYKLEDPLESLLNPFVFDSLEKKYGKQPSWPKSERKLLFDRIRCGLSDILRPYMCISTWRQYRTKRRAIQYNQEVIKEELLTALVNQEKEARRASSQKMDGLERYWLELEEDLQIVVEEMEVILIDELVEEIISTDV